MKHIITLTLCLFIFLSFGQNEPQSNSPSWVEMMQDPKANFYDVQRAFNDYWKDREIAPGKGYKQFKRWEAYMAPRVYPTGEMTQASLAYENFKIWEKQHPQHSDKSLTGNWISKGPIGKPAWGGAGRLNFVRFDPNNSNTIYVGSPDGGLWKSTNAGSTWTTNTDDLAVIGCSDVAIDPTNTQIMYLATGDGDARDKYSIGVLKSTNGGATWSTTGLNWSVSNGRTISKLLIDPSDPTVIIAATSAGIWRSSDSGANWINERTGSYKDMEFQPGNSNVIYAAGTSYVRSTDNGLNWSTITSGLSTTSVSRIAIAVTPANSNYVYLLYGSSVDQSLKGVYLSTNGGTSFSRADNGSVNLLGRDANGLDFGVGQAFYDLTIAASPTNAQEVIIGGINTWKSTNAGSTWSLLTHWWGNSAPEIHADQHDVVYQGSAIYAANDGGLFRTTNNGSSWTDLSSNLTIAQQYRIGLSASNSNLIISGHQDNGSNLMNTSTWTNVVGGDGMDCIIDRTNNNIIYASVQYGSHRRSTDGGGSFTNISGALPEGAWISTLRQDPSVANTIYAGGRPNLYKSTDRGSNWNTLGSPDGSSNIIEFYIAPSNNQVIYALNYNQVSKSTNGGVSWSSVSSGLPVSSYQPAYVIVSDNDPNKAWVCFSGYGSTSKVYKTTNGGASWSNLSTGLPNLPCNTLVNDKNSASDGIYVGTDIGVYYRDNLMSTWVFFSTGLPNVAVRDLEIYYPTNLLRAATFGRGTWESDLYLVNTPPVADFSGTPTTIFEGQSVTFTDLSTNSPTSLSWSFPGAATTSSTQSSPVITYNVAGTYNVSLTASNISGSDVETKTAYIVVQALTPPTAAFIGTPTSLQQGQTVSYTNQSTGTITQTLWSFPGGTPSSSSAANPTVTYNTPGTYDATLVVGNSGGSTTESKANYITVSAILVPVSDFSSTNANICPGSSVTFTSTATNDPTSYSWSFPGGTPATSTSPNPTVVYATNGSYNVSLTSSNVAGSNTETKAAFVTVGGGTGISLPFSEGFTSGIVPPNAAWTVVNNGGTGDWAHSNTVGLAPTAGNSMMFDNYSVDDRGFDDEVRLPGFDLNTNQNAKLVFDVAYAAYGVNDADGLEILASTDCGQTFSSIYLKIGPALATAPDITSLYTPADASEWRSDTVNLSAYNGSANVILAFKNRADYGNVMYIDNIELYASQNAPQAEFTKGSSTICSGNSVTYTSTSTGGPSTFNWTFPGGSPATSTSPNPTVSYATAGTYDVSLTVSNSSGSDSQTKTGFISVLASPAIPTISTSGPVNFCSGENVTLTSSASSGNLWSSGQSSQSITIASSGSFMVTVNESGCTTNSTPVVVAVTPTPLISGTNSSDASDCVSFDGSITLIGSGSGDLNWTGTATGSAVGVSLPYTINNLTIGTYTFTMTNGSCSSNTISENVNTTGQPTKPTISASGATTFCAGGSVTLTSSSASNNIWSTGDTGQSIVVNQAGTYGVYVFDNGCSSATAEVTTVVQPAVTISAGSLIHPSNCGSANGSIEVNGTGTGTLSWSGSASAGSSTVNLPANITNLLAGSYNVTFNDGCPSNVISLALVDPGAPTTPTITAGGSLTFCEGESLTLTSSSTLNNNWSTGEKTASITVTQSGTYSLNVVENGCVSGSDQITIDVTPSPAISAGLLINPATCGSNTGSIQIIGSGVGTISWVGTSANGSTTISLPGTIANLKAGSYNITFDDGCLSNNLALTLTDPGAPSTPLITASGPLIFCEGDSVVLTSSVASNNFWSNGETTNAITVKISGNYSTTVSSGSCSSSSLISVVKVNALPVVTLANFTPLCSSQGSISLDGGLPLGGTYSGTGVTGTSFDPLLADTGSHPITYTVIDQNLCESSMTKQIEVVFCASIESLDPANIAIYPNPSHDVVHVQLKGNNAFTKIELINALGQLVATWKIEQQNMDLNVSDFAAGSYQLKFSGKQGVLRKTIQLRD